MRVEAELDQARKAAAGIKQEGTTVLVVAVEVIVRSARSESLPSRGRLKADPPDQLACYS
jgi:hypothetical protein